MTQHVFDPVTQQYFNPATGQYFNQASQTWYTPAPMPGPPPPAAYAPPAAADDLAALDDESGLGNDASSQRLPNFDFREHLVPGAAPVPRDATYDVRIARFTTFETDERDKYILLEGLILASDNAELPAGCSAKWMRPLARDKYGYTEREIQRVIRAIQRIVDDADPRAVALNTKGSPGNYKVVLRGMLDSERGPGTAQGAVIRVVASPQSSKKGKGCYGPEGQKYSNRDFLPAPDGAGVPPVLGGPPAPPPVAAQGAIHVAPPPAPAAPPPPPPPAYAPPAPPAPPPAYAPPAPTAYAPPPAPPVYPQAPPAPPPPPAAHPIPRWWDGTKWVH